jgi:DNA uptake protein ComE-like DNA-binding protein
MFRRLMDRGLISVLGLTLIAAGCNWNRSESANDEEQRQQDEKTRENVAKATERLKPSIETAGRKLGEVAEKAGEDARAAAQGVKEGWARGANEPVDLNSGSEKELAELSGITEHDAKKIIRSRPYHNKHDLVAKGVLSNSLYAKIQDQITVK